jgi:hypothetical protein
MKVLLFTVSKPLAVSDSSEKVSKTSSNSKVKKSPAARRAARDAAGQSSAQTDRSRAGQRCFRCCRCPAVLRAVMPS